MNIQQYIPELIKENDEALRALAPRGERVTASIFGGAGWEPAETEEEFRVRKERAHRGAAQLRAALLDEAFIRSLEEAELQLGPNGGASIYDRWGNCLGPTVAWHVRFLNGSPVQEQVEGVE